MKLALLLMVAGTLHASAAIHGQTVTLKKKNVKMTAVLKDIQKQTGYNIFYDASVITDKWVVSVDFANQSIEKTLESLLGRYSFDFTIVDKNIVLKYGDERRTDLNSTQPAIVHVQSAVEGTIKSADGANMANVSVTEKGTRHTVMSDATGNFKMMVPSDAILIFSSVGFGRQEVAVNNRSSIQVVMVPTMTHVEEVVVVGYGVQKKENLTGAVSTIDRGKIENRPIANLSSALAGLAPGLQISQSSGSRPGYDGAKIRVRGQGTLNNANPLVIIDGAEGNMGDLNPDDVDNISILKDASSAAIYGSRAANGVILITTKKGKAGNSILTYQGLAAAQHVSNKMDIVSNYADFMELQNEGYKNSKLSPNFSQEKIDEWRSAGDSDPIKYPNTDWQEEFFRTGYQQNHNISASGGGERSRYFFSGGYLNNPGIIKNAEYERYQARVNLDADVKPWLTLGANIFGYVAMNNPNSVAASEAGDAVYGGALGTTPGMVLLHPDGRFGGMNNTEDQSGSQNNNPFRRMNFYKHEFPVITNKLTPRFYARLKPIENLTIEGSYTYNYTDQQEERHLQDADLWNFYTNTISRSGTVRTYINTFNYKTVQQLMDITARYTYDTGKLKSQAMVGASQEAYKYKWIRAMKYDLLDESLSVLDAATKDDRALGNMTQWAMHSYFGRLNLNWDDKYLLEANVRTDGSSRFAPGKSRWGVFPSFSAGWNITNESYLEGVTWLSSLKLRGSWGALGNNHTATNYMYQSLYGPANYVLNSALIGGFAQTVLSDPNLTWETTYVSNLGVDFSLLKSRLSGSMEYFIKDTKGILISLPAPLVHGTSTVPSQNVAEVRNNGFEINLDWKDKIGEVGYSIGGNFSYIQNKVTKFRGKTSSVSGTNMILEGRPINVQYVLAVDRIVQTQEDLDYVAGMVENNSAAFASYTRPELGDFLYKDTDGDGKITPADRIEVGKGTNPLVSYGINLGASWKGLDFFALLQGVSGIKVYYQNDSWRYTIRHGLQINKVIADGRWYEGRTDATYPRLLENGDARNTQPSDAYIFDKSYVRIKNLQLGYTLPTDISKRFAVEKMRIFSSIENPFTFTDFVGLDPEIESNVNYPTIKLYSLGINLTF